MLYVVELRGEREELSTLMARVREWLDAQRFEPDAFRCTTDERSVTCRLEFKLEPEAIACTKQFGGEVSSPGDQAIVWTDVVT
jgi:hypothetical protein